MVLRATAAPSAWTCAARAGWSAAGFGRQTIGTPCASDAATVPCPAWVTVAADDARPLVLVSFSTGPYWDQASRIQRTVVALADGGWRVFVTTGSTDVAGIAVPRNAVLIRHAPHAEILPHAAVRESATAADIEAAVHRVLAHPSYAAAARRLAKAIAGAPGAAMAVRRLEELAQPTLQPLSTKR